MAGVRDSLAEAVSATGKFVRVASGFRDIISVSHPIYKPEHQRYHLYISLACPWANRCSVALKLKGLDDCIGVSVTHPTWQRSRPNIPEDSHHGWVFCDETEDLKSPSGCGSFILEKSTIDSINGCRNVRDLYDLSAKNSGTPCAQKFSVPILWDKVTGTIVNNESSEILRIFNSEFDEWATGPNANIDLYPANKRERIDEINQLVYESINNGVYKCGFCRTQDAYNDAVDNLFVALDHVEQILSKSRYLIGNSLTEADIRLFMTLVRFDEVYIVYFKCNVRRIIDYPNIRNYCRDMYQFPGIAESISMEHIKTHYFTSHTILNPYAIIPKGPDSISDFKLSHNRYNM